MNKKIIQKIKPKKRLRKSCKKTGSVLMTTIIISAILLSISLGLSRIFLRELQISQKFFAVEKSYISAESGVETVLLEFKTNPIFAKSFKEDLTANESFEIDIKSMNKFILKPSETRRFRTKIHTGGNNFKEIDLSKLEANFTGKIRWVISCADKGGVFSLEGEKTNDGKLSSWQGKFDDLKTNNETISIQTFWNNKIIKIDNKKCFLNIENLGKDDLDFEFIGEISPAESKIVSTGSVENFPDIKKKIEFIYRQDNLDSIFDFGNI